jgi:RNA methyltransferase, TrmH family
MLSKNKIKFIRSLESKKDRMEAGLFVAEGEKLVNEILLSSLETVYIAATYEWFERNKFIHITNIPDKDMVSQDELNKISFLKTPQEVICLVKLPKYHLSLKSLKDNLSLMLDTIQDPGNLGTILRIADWFGIENVICSHETADAFNPKVVQSTMGAICRVKIHYTGLAEAVAETKLLRIPIYGTTLNGENIYNATLSENGIIMMGNESKGILPAWIPFIDKQLFIPFYPSDNQRSESLNVAVATAIVCSEFRRRC